MALRCDSGNPVDSDSNGNPPSGTPNETPMASIHGNVMVGGSGLRGAHVSLAGAGIARAAISAWDGAFRFADLPPGTYTLTVVLSGFACESASADVQAGHTATPSIVCVDVRGTITGTVTAGGTPLPGIAVNLSALSAVARIASTDEAGVFEFAFVPAGDDYIVSASPEGTTCESASAPLKANQTVLVEVVCQPTGQLVVWVGTPEGWGILANVTASGPVHREAAVSWNAGRVFDELPPGEYTLTATTWSGTCESVATTVQVARITSVQIVCELDLNVGGDDIAGDWSFYLPREDEFGFPVYVQAGNCPALLPEQGSGSIRFDSSKDTVSIVWLFDPEFMIVGRFQGFDFVEDGFSGTGGAVRADGSSIQSEVTGTFGFFVVDGSVYFWFSGSMTREHRDPGGDLVCTETYTVVGDRRR